MARTSGPIDAASGRTSTRLEPARPVPLLPFPGGPSELLDRARTETFLFARTRHAPFQDLASHAHENATVTILLGGASEEQAPPRRFDCGPGSVLVRPPGAVHRDRFGEEGSVNLEIEVLPAELETLRRLTTVFEEHAHRKAPDLHRLARRLASEIAHDDAARLLAIEGLALELLASASRGASPERRGPPPSWLRRVRERLHDEPARAHRLRDLAAEAGVTPTHLARAFRAYFGLRPADALRRARLEAATAAILDGDASLAEIAAATGFADQSHLGRAFRAEHGVSPARYRRENR